MLITVKYGLFPITKKEIRAIFFADLFLFVEKSPYFTVISMKFAIKIHCKSTAHRACQTMQIFKDVTCPYFWKSGGGSRGGVALMR